MRVLITGITGFAGSHLAEYCLRWGDEVWGTKRWRSPMDNINHLQKDIRLAECELTDMHAVETMLAAVKPDWVFNLAAQSYVGSSFTDPASTLNNNIQIQLNFLECLRKGMFGRMLSIGSSEEYGFVKPDEVPIKETNPLRPLSPYGVSKVATDLLAYQYFKSYGLHVVRARAFNHEGERRGHVFVISNFAKQIVEIEKHMREPVIHHGNLEAKRDFTDVRDTIRAYYMLLDKGRPGEVYNIATGTSWPISYVLQKLADMSYCRRSVSSLLNPYIKAIEFKLDESRLRPSDVPILQGDATKITEELDWRPEISLETTLRDTLEYWQKKIWL